MEAPVTVGKSPLVIYAIVVIMGDVLPYQGVNYRIMHHEDPGFKLSDRAKSLEVVLY